MFEKWAEEKVRAMQLDAGILHTTNLTSFSSLLNVISLRTDEGDYESQLPMFLINLNLKRLGCGVRSALNLAYPTYAFLSLFTPSSFIQYANEDQRRGIDSCKRIEHLL